MAAVTTLTEMPRSAGRKCRDLGPGTTESGHPMLNGSPASSSLLLVSATPLPLSVPFGPLSCGGI
jgi:hypothetical protein